MRDYFYFHYFYCKFSKYGYFWGAAAPSLYLPAMKYLCQLQAPTSRLIDMSRWKERNFYNRIFSD